MWPPRRRSDRRSLRDAPRGDLDRVDLAIDPGAPAERRGRGQQHVGAGAARAATKRPERSRASAAMTPVSDGHGPDRRDAGALGGELAAAQRSGDRRRRVRGRRRARAAHVTATTRPSARAFIGRPWAAPYAPPCLRLGDAPAAADGEAQRARAAVARDEAHRRGALRARPAQVDQRRPARAVQDPRAATPTRGRCAARRSGSRGRRRARPARAGARAAR